MGVFQALGSSEIVHRGTVRTTCKQLDGSHRLQYAGAHHITATNGLAYLSPPDACSLSALKPPFHGACVGVVSAPTLSARLPRRARAAFEKERFHYEHSPCFHGADCRAD